MILLATGVTIKEKGERLTSLGGAKTQYQEQRRGNPSFTQEGGKTEVLFRGNDYPRRKKRGGRGGQNPLSHYDNGKGGRQKIRRRSTHFSTLRVRKRSRFSHEARKGGVKRAFSAQKEGGLLTRGEKEKGGKNIPRLARRRI